MPDAPAKTYKEQLLADLESARVNAYEAMRAGEMSGKEWGTFGLLLATATDYAKGDRVVRERLGG